MKNNPYRLDITDLLQCLDEIQSALKVTRPVLLVACGGTALTLKGWKDSTKDVDFLIPHESDYQSLIKAMKYLGYREQSAFGWLHPAHPFIFDLFSGQTIYTTALLESVHEEPLHQVIKKFPRLVLTVLNSADLVISKLFRGNQVDVDDSMMVIKNEPEVDLGALLERFIQTAEFDTNPQKCKTNFGYFLDELDRQNFAAQAVRGRWELWIP